MEPLSKIISRQPKADRWLIYLFQQIKRERLSLILGAGISSNARLPLWRELIDRISGKVPDFPDDTKEQLISKVNPTYFTQIAFQRFREVTRSEDKYQSDDFMSGKYALHLNLFLNEEWARIIHSALYQECLDDIESIIENHPYLELLSRVAFRTPYVLNFNFDDILSESMRYLASSAFNPREPLPLPEVTWRPPAIIRQDSVVIYHINGLLPRVTGRKRSEELVFTENAFADTLLNTSGMAFEHLLSSICASTNLIVGHSLEDASLKNLLRSSKLRTPAVFHFLLHWMQDGAELSNDVMKDIFDVNLEVYNVITIFCTTQEIAGLLSLLSIHSEDEFIDEMRKIGITRMKYQYYVVGAVGSGKTSTLENLRAFQTFEEWISNPPAAMYKEHYRLTDSERQAIEDWVVGQLTQKNRKLRQHSVGFAFMDRAPLDALAFSADESERKTKAKRLREAVFASEPIESGELIFLEATGSELERRNLVRGRFPEESGKAVYLEEQSKNLKELYQPSVLIDSKDYRADEVAEQVARRALFGDYNPVDLMSILERQYD